MAVPSDIDAQITLELSGESLTSGELRKSIDAFDGLLGAMTRSVCRDDTSVEWFVRVKHGSLLFCADPEETADPDVIDEIKLVARRSLEGRPPAVHSDDVVKHVEALSGIPKTRLWVGREGHDITDDVCRTMKAALRPAYAIPGSVEGRLSTLSEHRDLAIYEPVWGKRIGCAVPDELLDGMRHLWRRRVTARGVVHYRSDGVPARIDAESVEPFPDDDELPSHMDVLGILRAEQCPNDPRDVIGIRTVSLSGSSRKPTRSKRAGRS